MLDSSVEGINVTPSRANTLPNEDDTRMVPAPIKKKAAIVPRILTQVGPIKVELFEAYVLAKRESQTNSFDADFTVS